ncbi:MAG: VanZ family protein [Chloroflexi bacterium]|nr:VanZ family protein [Chloroflexota bacterium]
MNLVFLGPFGLRPKATMSARAVPLAEALARRGHAVTIVVPPYDYPADSGREEYIGSVHILNVSIPPKIPGLWYFVVTWRLLRLTLDLRPDVVHAFKPKGFAGLAAAVLHLLGLLGLSRARVVVDTDDWEGAGGWNDVPGYNRAMRLFFPLQEKWVLRQANAVTVASRSLAEMVAAIRRTQDNVFYLPNGIRARPGSPGLPPVGTASGHGRHPTVLLYTRFFEYKVARALDVLERVAASVPEVRLLVVGKGLFGEETEMARLAKEMGLTSKVVQTGWVGAADLSACFAAADVAIYPFDDTLINRTKCSVKLLELLGAGLPVVADRVGQNTEYIEDGKSGMLVAPGDVEAMASAVGELLQNRETARAMGCCARKRVAAEFNWEKWSVEAERAYERAMAREPRSRVVLAWLPVSLWMGAIFFLSSQSALPHLPEPFLQTFTAKLIHLSEYAVLALLLFRAFRVASFVSGRLRLALIFSILVSALYAASDEFHQSFTPNRHPAVVDVLIDLCGASLALGVTLWSQRPIHRRIGRQSG